MAAVAILQHYLDAQRARARDDAAHARHDAGRRGRRAPVPSACGRCALCAPARPSCGPARRRAQRARHRAQAARRSRRSPTRSPRTAIIASPRGSCCGPRAATAIVSRGTAAWTATCAPGRYEFPRGETDADDPRRHAQPAAPTTTLFTVPEGYTIEEIAAEAARAKLGMDSAAFVAATRDPALRAGSASRTTSSRSRATSSRRRTGSPFGESPRAAGRADGAAVPERVGHAPGTRRAAAVGLTPPPGAHAGEHRRGGGAESLASARSSPGCTSTVCKRRAADEARGRPDGDLRAAAST